MCKSKLSPDVQKYVESYIDDDIAVTISMGLLEANVKPLGIKEIQEIKKRVLDRIREIVHRRDEFIEVMQPYKSEL